MMEKKITQILKESVKKLESAKFPTPQLDAEVLLAHILGKPREYVLAHPQQKLTEARVTDYELLVTRRSRGEPVAYITGHKEFYGLDFNVTKDTLIPRPETELMVDEALGVKNVR